jgi:hypothetical protein
MEFGEMVSAKRLFGEVASAKWNLVKWLSAKWNSVKWTIRQNNPLAKRPFGETSLRRTSLQRNIPLAKWLSEKCTVSTVTLLDWSRIYIFCGTTKKKGIYKQYFII